MDSHIIMHFLNLLPKVVLFYWILTVIGLAQYNIFLIGAALFLDVLDYLSDIMKM